MSHLDELFLRRPRRRRVVTLCRAVAYQFRRLAIREPAVLMHQVRVAVPPLRFHMHTSHGSRSRVGRRRATATARTSPCTVAAERTRLSRRAETKANVVSRGIGHV